MRLGETEEDYYRLGAMLASAVEADTANADAEAANAAGARPDDHQSGASQ
jgi:hypothetical protein